MSREVTVLRRPGKFPLVRGSARRARSPLQHRPVTSTSARRWYAHPVLVFGVVWAVILGIFFAPLLAGGVIMNPMSDGKDG